MFNISFPKGILFRKKDDVVMYDNHRKKNQDPCLENEQESENVNHKSGMSG
ncbi:hypothetical protein FH5_02020 [Priestia endophytica]|nr:hypothetical protein FH5_02020 [Priestia endophytica]